jgi:hypothetical protein
VTLGELLAAYGERVAGGSFAIDGNGVCELAFARSGVRVVVEPVPGETEAQLWCALGPLPPMHAAAREALLRRLLEGNLFGLATGGAALALDGTREEVLLCQGFAPERLDAEGFAALVEGFADIATLWARELAQPAEVQPGADEPAPRPGLEGMIRG